MVYTTPVELDDELDDTALETELELLTALELDEATLDLELLMMELTVLDFDETTALDTLDTLEDELELPLGAIPQTSVPFTVAVTLFQSV